MTFNISTLREQDTELIAVIQDSIDNYRQPIRILLENDSSVISEVTVSCSGITLDSSDYNFTPPKVIPSRVLASVFQRPSKVSYVSNSLTATEIKESVIKLIQIIDTISYPKVSQDFQECSVCLEMTNKTTKCLHPLCESCGDVMEKMFLKKFDAAAAEAEYEKRGIDWTDKRTKMPCCPMCRKYIM